MNGLDTRGHAVGIDSIFSEVLVRSSQVCYTVLVQARAFVDAQRIGENTEFHYDSAPQHLLRLPGDVVEPRPFLSFTEAWDELCV